ncbi:hypothetical protein HJG53_06265 [Sphingomonas sp. ID1715]|nr:hypothetical protein [Sphingomonas sp. ID1715]
MRLKFLARYRARFFGFLGFFGVVISAVVGLPGMFEVEEALPEQVLNAGILGSE